MNMRNKFALIGAFVISMLPQAGGAQEEDAHSVGCLPQATVQEPASVCSACHKDSVSRWASHQDRPCTPYCMSCHKTAEMERHHTVGAVLTRLPDETLKVTSDKKIACTTCHDLSSRRYDSVRWKAASLYDRLFRPQTRYKTYFLARRNDRGQLCLSCH